MNEFRIIENAGGVPGLMVALNAFTEEVEHGFYILFKGDTLSHMHMVLYYIN
jgi:hypothetical protein